MSESLPIGVERLMVGDVMPVVPLAIDSEEDETIDGVPIGAWMAPFIAAGAV